MIKFTVSETDSTESLPNLIGKILQTSNLSLTHLNIYKCPIIKCIWGYEQPQEVKKILKTIKFATLPNLISLNLSGNKNWWNKEVEKYYYTQEKLFPLLLQIIQNKAQLKVLDLHGIYFSVEQTEILLKTITEAEILRSLTNLNLSRSANFSSDTSVKYLALILAKA